MIAVTAVTALLLNGCRATHPLPFPASLNSPRPEDSAMAAKMAVDYPYTSPEARRTVIELLVGRLDDEDDAVRFFAIIALEKMCGTRMGYEYHDPPYVRSRAIAAWRRYLIQKAKVADADAVATQPSVESMSSNAGGGHCP